MERGRGVLLGLFSLVGLGWCLMRSLDPDVKTLLALEHDEVCALATLHLAGAITFVCGCGVGVWLALGSFEGRLASIGVVGVLLTFVWLALLPDSISSLGYFASLQQCGATRFQWLVFVVVLVAYGAAAVGWPRPEEARPRR